MADEERYDGREYDRVVDQAYMALWTLPDKWVVHLEDWDDKKKQIRSVGSLDGIGPFPQRLRDRLRPRRVPFIDLHHLNESLVIGIFISGPMDAPPHHDFKGILDAPIGGRYRSLNRIPTPHYIALLESLGGRTDWGHLEGSTAQSEARNNEFVKATAVYLRSFEKP